MKMTKNDALIRQMNILPDGSLGDLLLVIDMQNVYLEGQQWGCSSTGKVLKNIQKLIDNHVPDNVVFTKFTPAEHPEGTWKQYNAKNRKINSNVWMSDIIAELKQYLDTYPLFEKHAYSAYTNREVALLASKARRVLLSGVVAECCVLFTLLSGIDAGNKMVYLSDACSGSSREHERLIADLAGYFATTHTQVMTCEEYMKQVYA